MTSRTLYKHLIHYKLKIEANLTKPHIIARCLDKLIGSPFEVSHIQDSGIMDTFYRMPRYEGECGEQLRRLLLKWKSMLVSSIYQPMSKSMWDNLNLVPNTPEGLAFLKSFEQDADEYNENNDNNEDHGGSNGVKDWLKDSHVPIYSNDPTPDPYLNNNNNDEPKYELVYEQNYDDMDLENGLRDSLVFNNNNYQNEDENNYITPDCDLNDFQVDLDGRCRNWLVEQSIQAFPTDPL